jgi:predicted ATP-dependent endonuclease of OLD family
MQQCREEDFSFLERQQKAQKLVAFDATKSELLFARRALLVEGQADRLAVLATATALGHDPDAEDLAIVNCASKSNIPFFARICRALSVPFVIVHDDDLHDIPEGADEQARSQAQAENARAGLINGEIREARRWGQGLRHESESGNRPGYWSSCS